MSTQTKHTPGPWSADQMQDGKWIIHRRDSGYKSLIGYTAIGDLLGHGGSEEANARLIAAAPELIEALRECADELEAALMRAGGPENAANRYNLRKRAQLARSAISKVEGTK